MMKKGKLLKFLITSAFAAGVFLIPVNANATTETAEPATTAAATATSDFAGQTMSKGVLIEALMFPG